MFKVLSRIAIMASGFIMLFISVSLAVAWVQPGDVVSLASRRLVDVRTQVTFEMPVPSTTHVFSSWSSDGQSLALVGRQTDDNHIYLLDVATGDIRNLTERIIFHWVAYPIWSPDGTAIAFMGAIDDVPYLYIAEPESDSLYKVSERPLYVLGGYLSWSPDSQQVAFVSVEDNVPVVCITSREADRDVHCPIAGEHPSWSPDGTHIAYKYGGIHMYNLQTGEVQELTTDGDAPTWSPDGAYIAFMRRASVIGVEMWEQQLHIMDANGGNQRIVARPLTHEWSIPTWSSDSRRLFTVQSDRKTLQITDIYTETTRTIQFAEQVTFPVTRPQG